MTASRCPRPGPPAEGPQAPDQPPPAAHLQDDGELLGRAPVLHAHGQPHLERGQLLGKEGAVLGDRQRGVSQRAALLEAARPPCPLPSRSVTAVGGAAVPATGAVRGETEQAPGCAAQQSRGHTQTGCG